MPSFYFFRSDGFSKFFGFPIFFEICLHRKKNRRESYTSTIFKNDTAFESPSLDLSETPIQSKIVEVKKWLRGVHFFADFLCDKIV